MPTFDFSYKAMDPIMNSFTTAVQPANLSSSTTANSPTVGLFPFATTTSSSMFGRLALFKGAVPTDLSALYPTTTGVISTNMLLLFNHLKEGSGSVSPFAKFTSNPNSTDAYDKLVKNFLTIEFPYVAASASGSATWFAIYVSNAANQTFHTITGSVGAIGSGADLEIPYTNIIQGAQYRLAPFSIQFPTKIAY